MIRHITKAGEVKDISEITLKKSDAEMIYALIARKEKSCQSLMRTSKEQMTA